MRAPTASSWGQLIETMQQSATALAQGLTGSRRQLTGAATCHCLNKHHIGGTGGSQKHVVEIVK